MLIPLRKTLAELSKREHLLQKKLLMLKLHAKVAKIEEMKAQLQKDEQAHEIEEKRLAQQKAQHDKHLAEIAKHLSVLSAEEQGVLPGSSRDDDDDDDDDDDGNSEDDAGEDARKSEEEDAEEKAEEEAEEAGEASEASDVMMTCHCRFCRERQ